MRNTARQTRANCTITIDFQNEATYLQLLGDGKAFLECVLAFVLALGLQLKHKTTCRGGGCLTRHSHYVRKTLRLPRCLRRGGMRAFGEGLNAYGPQKLPHALDDILPTCENRRRYSPVLRRMLRQ